ncbi:MAG: MgtC/SapB family protein [Pyrinomonadaceae bacterium]|nr:MgtC/SapB family protein [Pyrinomonadaceae bacterium]
MDLLWNEIARGFPDANYLALVLIRLLASAVLGAAIGVQREVVGKPAGLRTHMLVSLGTTIFVLASIGSGFGNDALSRVIQGIVTGIGFIGAGSILKLDQKREIKGITTAASVWVAAAIGVTVGLGGLGLAVIGTVLALIVLTFVHRIEVRFGIDHDQGFKSEKEETGEKESAR